MNDRVRCNILWNSVGSIIYLGGQWLLSVLVVRTLGYTDAGIFSLAMSLTNTFYSLANYGIRNFQVSDLEGQFSDREYFINRILTSIAAIALCMLYCFIQRYSIYACMSIFWFMCFRVFEAFQDVYYGIEQKNADMKGIGISNILKGVFGVIVFSLTVVFSGCLNVAIFMMFLVILAVFILFDGRYIRRYMCGSISGKLCNAYRMIWICAPVALNDFMTNYILAYPKLAVERYMGEEALGIYSSVGMPVLIVQMASSYIFTPLITTFAEYLQKGKNAFFRKLLFKVVIFIVALGGGAFLAAGLGGKFFLKIIYDGDIWKYADILFPLVLCTTFTALVWFLNAILIICREHTGLCVSSAASLAILFLCGSGMIRWYSFNGASFTLCLALSVKITIMSVILFGKLKEISQ